MKDLIDICIIYIYIYIARHMHAMSLAERLARDVVDNMYIIDTGVLVMNTCVYICVYIHIYIYTQRERERYAVPCNPVPVSMPTVI